jgi:very-short-patch-repair endonuclease
MGKLSYQEAIEYLQTLPIKILSKPQWFIFVKEPWLFNPDFDKFPDFLPKNPRSYYLKTEGQFNFGIFLNTGNTNKKKFLNQEDYPLLFEEIDPKSGIDLNEYRINTQCYGVIPKLPWICKVCNFSWCATIKQRIYRDSGCPKCGITKQVNKFKKNIILKNGNLADKNPEILIYWDHEKNSKTPYDFTSRCKDEICLKCPNCHHQWNMSIICFANGRKKCPKCYGNLYQQEIRIFSEFTALGFTVIHKHKILKKECDIFVCELNLGIEIDGFPWHHGAEKNKYDLEKEKLFISEGIRFLRFRDSRLNRISDFEINYQQNKDIKEPFYNLIKKILTSYELGQKYIDKLEKYLDNNNFIGDEIFKNIYSYLIVPNSVSVKYPHLIEEWSKKNYPLEPRNISAHNNKKIWWTCPKCSEDYESSVYSRTKNGTGCPFCTNRKINSNNNFLNTHPNYIKKFNLIDINKHIDFKNIIAGSRISFINVQCEFGCIFNERIDRLTRKDSKTIKCRICNHKNTKPEEN